MWIVLFKDGDWLNMDEFTFGPFTSHELAYEFLCGLPACSDKGHKMIERVIVRPVHQARIMIEARRTRYKLQHV